MRYNLLEESQVSLVFYCILYLTFLICFIAEGDITNGNWYLLG